MQLRRRSILLALVALTAGALLALFMMKAIGDHRANVARGKAGDDWIDRCSRFYARASGLRDAEAAYLRGDTRLLSQWTTGTVSEQEIPGYSGDVSAVETKEFRYDHRLMPIAGDVLFKAPCQSYRYIEDYNLTILSLTNRRTIDQGR